MGVLHPHCSHNTTPRDCLRTIEFPGEIYSLSALACEQSGIHPGDENGDFFLCLFSQYGICDLPRTTLTGGAAGKS